MQNIIFDFNGTLFQDTHMHRRAWGEFFAGYGIAITDAQFYDSMCGPPNDAILRNILDPSLTDAQVEELSARKEAIYQDIIRAHPEWQVLTDGAPELLDTLKERDIPHAIATGAGRDNVQFYREVLGIGRWFDWDHIFYATSRIPGKPDPAIYRLAMEKLGFDPAATTVVEDALPGIQSAVAAGRRVIAIDTTLGPDGFAGIGEVRPSSTTFSALSAGSTPNDNHSKEDGT